MGGVCWSFNWYDQGLPACSDSTTWEVDGTGFVEWVATDSLGCQSGMVFELVDLGGPNALAGGDTTLCLGSTPNIMEFEFGNPLALGCNPASGVWSGEGASHEYFAEVWSEGNCIQPEEPWIDSVWVFNASELGDFEWIWTVVDCNGCVDHDTITVSVVEPTPPFIPSLDFCLGDPVGPVSPQAGACWSGAGIDPELCVQSRRRRLGRARVDGGLWRRQLCDARHRDCGDQTPTPSHRCCRWAQNPCIGTPFDLCLDDSHPGSESWTVAWSSYPDMDAAGGCEGLCCSLFNAQSGAVNAVVTDSKGCVGEAEQVISLATTIPVTVPDTLHFCADGGAHPLLGALPAFGLWGGEMVNDDTLFVTHEEGLFELTYSFVSPDGCPSEGSTVAQVVAVPEPEIATPNTVTCWLSPTLLQSADDGVWIGEGINTDGSIQWPHQAPTLINSPSEKVRAMHSTKSKSTFLPLPSSNILTSLEGTSTPLCSDDPCPSTFLRNTSQRTALSTGFALGCDGLQGVFPHFTFQPEDNCSITVVVTDDQRLHRFRDTHHCGACTSTVLSRARRGHVPWANPSSSMEKSYQDAMPMAWNGLGGCDTRRPNPGERRRTVHSGIARGRLQRMSAGGGTRNFGARRSDGQHRLGRFRGLRRPRCGHGGGRLRRKLELRVDLGGWKPSQAPDTPWVASTTASPPSMWMSLLPPKTSVASMTTRPP